ncbi:MFS transporter [Aciditerrimonas ferrireducens]|uniref:MFS transporter n=1 Tax=Aciditerrimonas ferrireducens TaxID=667306 RepID=A0ABV6BYX1_9ACTN|nr:MFS transporter [Aciditerrimonas ferrireducens]MCK4177804.1 MFS transporter [Aciditerrimonas ferrireducens]
MSTRTIFAAQDQARTGRFHLRTMFTTGMGVFSDGYSLSSIAIVLPLVLASFGRHSLTGIQSSLLTGSALAGMALGALVFGVLGNRGRKRYYGIDVVVMAVTALAQAFVPDVAWLIAVRFLFGIGAGADYVLSPTILGEHANVRDRGKLMLIGFGVSWVTGAALAGVVDLLCHAAGLSGGDTWRIVLAFGALPALTVVYLRRRLPETARFLARVRGDAAATAAVLAEVHAEEQVRRDLAGVRLVDRRSVLHYLARNRQAIVTSCVLWFLFDVIGYSSGLYGPTLIAKGLGLSPEVFTLVTYAAFSIPALLLAAAIVDKRGRRRMTAQWSVAAALALVAFGAYKDAVGIMAPGVALVLLGLFTVTGGVANAVPTSGMNGVELTPTKARTVVQGITVASGRAGATIAAFVFPALFAHLGESVAIYFLAAVTAVAAAVAWATLPEAAGRSLEAASDEELEGATTAPSPTPTETAA